MTNAEIDTDLLHPRQASEYERQLANEDIANFTLGMELWEIRMREALARGDPQEISDTEDAAIDELDSKWLYSGRLFAVAGKWWHPSLLEENYTSTEALLPRDSVSWEFVEDEVLGTYRSDGFAWRLVDGKPRLGFAFEMGSMQVKKPFVTSHLMCVAVGLPDGLSLSYMPEPTEAQSETHTERIKEKLELYDKLARLYMSQPDFTELPHNQQRRRVGNLVANANELITAPDLGIYMNLETSRFYERTETSTAYGFRLETSRRNEPITIAGQLLGVGILEQAVLDHKPLRTERDFIDRDAGLCLVVEAYVDGRAAQVHAPYAHIKLGEGAIAIYQNG